jgi:hypothetical protein
MAFIPETSKPKMSLNAIEHDKEFFKLIIHLMGSRNNLRDNALIWRLEISSFKKRELKTFPGK